MSMLDKLAAKIMPAESDEDRANARRVAEAMAGDNDWLAIVLQQHRQIEQCFADALSAGDASSRQSACKRLAVLLTGHSNAEESVLYPAMADYDEEGRAAMAYEEQATAKMQMAKLETLDPMSIEWREKLEHIQGAVLHHVYEEEGTWFPQLKQRTLPGDQARLTRRFLEEFERYAQTGQRQVPLQMAAQMSEHPDKGSHTWSAPTS
ncbi:MAG: hemerythrin domain-containing protein [Novosphingobium sp.]|nr:hemerythrin domain-containing protein [Novosphingobium sp.]